MPFLFKAMTARFYHWGEKLSVFTSDDRLVTSFGSPIASVPIKVKELQDFVCTLEQAIDDEPNVNQRIALGFIKHILQASLKQAHKDHEQIVEETPTGADLEEYMLSYSRAIKEGAF